MDCLSYTCAGAIIEVRLVGVECFGWCCRSQIRQPSRQRLLLGHGKPTIEVDVSNATSQHLPSQSALFLQEESWQGRLSCCVGALELRPCSTSPRARGRGRCSIKSNDVFLVREQGAKIVSKGDYFLRSFHRVVLPTEAFK